MKKNYKLTISYDGTRYSGWEKKKDKDTIQGKVETVLCKMCEVEALNLIGAGRTDAGVHARAMVANIFLNTEKTCEEILVYANKYLPDDICVEDVKEASERFHARYNAAGKTYRYTCFDGVTKPVFDRKYVTTLEFPVDVMKMQKAAQYLVGQHDFRSFCGNPKMKKSTVRTIESIEIKRSKGYVSIYVHGDGFLTHMVRIIAGTLIEVGRGKIAPEFMQNILDATNRQTAGFTAPAQGLMLMEIDY